MSATPPLTPVSWEQFSKGSTRRRGTRTESIAEVEQSPASTDWAFWSWFYFWIALFVGGLFASAYWGGWFETTA